MERHYCDYAGWGLKTMQMKMLAVQSSLLPSVS